MLFARGAPGTPFNAGELWEGATEWDTTQLNGACCHYPHWTGPRDGLHATGCRRHTFGLFYRAGYEPLKSMAVKSKAAQSGSRATSRTASRSGSRKAAPAAKTEEQTGAATETQERDSPLLDLSDQAVKRLLKTA